jgi:uncharacterized phage protein (TIGR02220 family)
MKLYQIRSWDALYENNRTRELKKLDWVPIPNKHDGDGYTSIMAQKDGPAILGAFIACIQIASRCDPRGTLLRDGGKPHSAASLARMSRMPESAIQRALDFCSGDEVNWLVIREINDNLAGGCDNPALACGNPAGECLEGKGREENGKKGREMYSADCRVALHWLNEKSGKRFRECESSLAPIQSRLDEPEVDIGGVKLMIERQCSMWKNTDMAEYLRPETLFRKSKFESYYAARGLPIPENGKPHSEQGGYHAV